MSIENEKNTRKRKNPITQLLGRLKRDEKGVTAVEFGIIAAPFLILIVALLETAHVHMTALDLENAVRDASRQIRTGQAQVANLSAQQFKNLVCDNTTLISDCKTTDLLVIDVRSYEDFDTISTDPADLYDDEGEFTGNDEYNMGSGLKVVVVRTYYKMKLLAQIPVVGLANAGPHHRMINAISVFRNEPFS